MQLKPQCSQFIKTINLVKHQSRFGLYQAIFFFGQCEGLSSISQWGCDNNRGGQKPGFPTWLEQHASCIQLYSKNPANMIATEAKKPHDIFKSRNRLKIHYCTSDSK